MLAENINKRMLFFACNHISGNTAHRPATGHVAYSLQMQIPKSECQFPTWKTRISGWAGPGLSHQFEFRVWKPTPQTPPPLCSWEGRSSPPGQPPAPRALTAPSDVDDEASVDHRAASKLLGRCHRVNGLLAFQDVADLGTGAQAWSAHQAEDRVERGGQGTQDPTCQDCTGPKGQDLRCYPKAGHFNHSIADMRGRRNSLW